jgi:hypothetical protein
MTSANNVPNGTDACCLLLRSSFSDLYRLRVEGLSSDPEHIYECDSLANSFRNVIHPGRAQRLPRNASARLHIQL